MGPRPYMQGMLGQLLQDQVAQDPCLTSSPHAAAPGVHLSSAALLKC